MAQDHTVTRRTLLGGAAATGLTAGIASTPQDISSARPMRVASRPEGRDRGMDTQRESEDQEPIGGEDSERVAKRAQLLPEEQSAGSDDPEAQAAAVLADSDERTEDPEGTRRKYSQTPDHRK